MSGSFVRVSEIILYPIGCTLKGLAAGTLPRCQARPCSFQPMGAVPFPRGGALSRRSPTTFRTSGRALRMLDDVIWACLRAETRVSSPVRSRPTAVAVGYLSFLTLP